MLQGEHSAILSTFIKLPFVIKNFVLSIFEWPLKTGFTALFNLLLSGKKKKVDTHHVPEKQETLKHAPHTQPPVTSSGSSTTQHHVAVPPQSHHFSFSVDLRSIKSVDSNTTQFVFLR